MFVAVNLCKDIEQQRHAVLMRVIGAMCLSRGVYVHSPVPRRCHLPQDGGLPEVPTAVRCHPGGWRKTDTCTQVGQRDIKNHSQVLSFYPSSIRDVWNLFDLLIYFLFWWQLYAIWFNPLVGVKILVELTPPKQTQLICLDVPFLVLHEKNTDILSLGALMYHYC